MKLFKFLTIGMTLFVSSCSNTNIQVQHSMSIVSDIEMNSSYALMAKRDISKESLSSLRDFVDQFPSVKIKKSLFGGRILILSSGAQFPTALSSDPRVLGVSSLSSKTIPFIEDPIRNTKDSGNDVMSPDATPSLHLSLLPDWPLPWVQYKEEYLYSHMALKADLSHAKVPYGSAGKGIGVCVLDTGLDGNHEEFKSARLIAYRDFAEGYPFPIDPWGHGTHVVGIIAAQFQNGALNRPSAIGPDGVVGVAPDVNLYVGRLYRAPGVSTPNWWENFLEAVDWCNLQLKSQGGSNDHVVINMSLGGLHDVGDPLLLPFEYAFEQFEHNGGLSIASAGNDSKDISADPTKVYFPAGLKSVIATASINSAKEASWSTNRGSKVEFAVPGESVFSTVPSTLKSTYGTASVNGLSPFEVIVTPANSSFKSVHNASITMNTIPRFPTAPDPLCDGPISGATGKIIFARAWWCGNLKTQVENAVKSGAVGLMLYNIDNDLSGLAYKASTPSPIPIVLLNHNDSVRLYQTLKQAMVTGKKLTGSIAILGSSQYDIKSGTSMAAPNAAAAAALVWSQKPHLTSAELRKLLQRTAQDLGAAGKDNIFGYGVIDTLAAIEE